jgi:hypothetical protein
MKNILLLYSAFLTLLLNSCCKEPVTPAAPVLPAKVQLIVGKTWQVKEVNNMTNCVNTHYLRGASGNTGANYDPLRFTFEADSTGTHTDTNGNTFPFFWSFQAGDSSRINIVVIAPTPVVYTWNLVEIWADKFITTSVVTSSGNQTLVSATYVPVTPVTATPQSLTRTQMLTQKQWLVSEVYDYSACSIKHYLAGASGNTGANYSIMRFKFNADGTGTHTDVLGGNYGITWQWTSADERNLKIVVNGTVTYNWNQVEINPGVLYSTTAMGTNVLDASRMITIP